MCAENPANGHLSLASFKCLLLQFYNKTLDLYDVDDVRTLKNENMKTVCPRCNIVRSSVPAVVPFLAI